MFSISLLTYSTSYGITERKQNSKSLDNKQTAEPRAGFGQHIQNGRFHSRIKIASQDSTHVKNIATPTAGKKERIGKAQGYGSYDDKNTNKTRVDNVRHGNVRNESKSRRKKSRLRKSNGKKRDDTMYAKKGGVIGDKKFRLKHHKNNRKALPKKQRIKEPEHNPKRQDSKYSIM